MQSSHTSVDFDLEQIFNDEAQYDINNWDDNIFSSSDDFSVETTLYGEEEEEDNEYEEREERKAGDHRYNNNNDDARISRNQENAMTNLLQLVKEHEKQQQNTSYQNNPSSTSAAATISNNLQELNACQAPIKAKSTKVKRIDKTIRPRVLTENYDRDKPFRVTLDPTSKLCNDRVWKLFYNDLIIIGFVKNISAAPPEQLESLSCTNLVTDGNIYRSIISRLPLKYSVRLAIYRFICKLLYTHFNKSNVDNSSKRIDIFKAESIDCFNENVKKKIIVFFRKFILPIEPLSRKEKAKMKRGKQQQYDQEQGVNEVETKKLRIKLKNVFFDYTKHKTWRPTIISSVELQVLNSCQSVNKNSDILFSRMPSIPAVATDNYYFDLADDYANLLKRYAKKEPDILEDLQSNTLAKFKWTDGQEKNKLSIGHLRSKFLRELCGSAELCAVFALKQIYGTEDLFKQQCRLINEFIIDEMYHRNSNYNEMRLNFGDKRDVSPSSLLESSQHTNSIRTQNAEIEDNSSSKKYNNKRPLIAVVKQVVDIEHPKRVKLMTNPVSSSSSSALCEVGSKNAVVLHSNDTKCKILPPKAASSTLSSLFTGDDTGNTFKQYTCTTLEEEEELLEEFELTQFRQCNKISRRAVLVTVLALIVSAIFQKDNLYIYTIITVNTGLILFYSMLLWANEAVKETATLHFTQNIMGVIINVIPLVCFAVFFSAADTSKLKKPNIARLCVICIIRFTLAMLPTAMHIPFFPYRVCMIFSMSIGIYLQPEIMCYGPPLFNGITALSIMLLGDYIGTRIVNHNKQKFMSIRLDPECQQITKKVFECK